MNHHIFTVYDAKTEAYFPPFFARTRGEAMRMFADSANDPNHLFCKHPEDYTLFHLGMWEDNQCAFNIGQVTAISRAHEVKKTEFDRHDESMRLEVEHNNRLINKFEQVEEDHQEPVLPLIGETDPDTGLPGKPNGAPTPDEM